MKRPDSLSFAWPSRASSGRDAALVGRPDARCTGTQYGREVERAAALLKEKKNRLGRAGTRPRTQGRHGQLLQVAFREKKRRGGRPRRVRGCYLLAEDGLIWRSCSTRLRARSCNSTRRVFHQGP